MREFFSQLIAGIRESWDRLSASARINIGLSAAAVGVFLILVIVSTTRAEFVQLYSGLDQTDSMSIRTYLDENSIPYKPKRQGSIIEVPMKQRSSVMIALRDQNLPAQHGSIPGFEIFDRQNLMTNRYLQDINFTRSVQGELQRSLIYYDFVKGASVYIREAKKAMFSGEQELSEAAVVLDVTHFPTKQEIQLLIAHIGTYGGAQLDHRSITISTRDGKPIYLPPRDEFAAIAGTRLEHQLDVERTIMQKIEDRFERIGKKVVATVSVKIDTRRRQERVHTAADGTILSTQDVRSNITTDEAPPEGPVGTTANPPAGSQVVSAISHNETTSTLTENFEPTLTETQTTYEPGEVTGYGVVLMVDTGFEDELDADGNPTGQQTPITLSDADVQRYQETVAPMVGPDVLASAVVIYGQPFGLPETPVVAGEWFAPQQLGETLSSRWAMLVVQIIVLMVGFMLVRRWLLRAIIIPEEAVEEITEEAIEAERVDETREMMEELERAAGESPEMFASLLRTWMSGPAEE
jgi:flagellar M-ring protein FliF